MSSLGERIRYARDQKGYLQGELARLIGVKSAGVISNWEKDLNKPDAEKIVMLCDVLDVSASFLLDYYGKSSFEFTPAEEDHVRKYRALDEHGKRIIDLVLSEEINRISEVVQKSTAVPVRLISYYYKNASAGTGQLIIDNLPEKDIEIPDIPEYKYVSYAIGVNGSSMEPAYSDGDILLVEATKEIHIGDIGIFQIDDQCYVKKLGDNELISINEDYDNIPLNESARTMGKVIGKL